MCQASSILSVRVLLQKDSAFFSPRNFHFQPSIPAVELVLPPNHHLNAQSETRGCPIFPGIYYFWGHTVAFRLSLPASVVYEFHCLYGYSHMSQFMPSRKQTPS